MEFRIRRAHVLGEKPQENFVSLDAIAPAPKKDADKEVGSFGD